MRQADDARTLPQTRSSVACDDDAVSERDSSELCERWRRIEREILLKRAEAHVRALADDAHGRIKLCARCERAHVRSAAMMRRHKHQADGTDDADTYTGTRTPFHTNNTRERTDRERPRDGHEAGSHAIAVLKSERECVWHMRDGGRM